MFSYHRCSFIKPHGDPALGQLAIFAVDGRPLLSYASPDILSLCPSYLFALEISSGGCGSVVSVRQSTSFYRLANGAGHADRETSSQEERAYCYLGGDYHSANLSF